MTCDLSKSQRMYDLIQTRKEGGISFGHLKRIPGPGKPQLRGIHGANDRFIDATASKKSGSLRAFPHPDGTKPDAKEARASNLNAIRERY